MKLRLAGFALAALLLGLPHCARASGLPVWYLSQSRLGLVCFDQIDTDAALNCWLNHHPDIAGAMIYGDSVYSGAWPTWPAAVNDQMHQYFNQMVLWYRAGMPSTGYPQPYAVPIPFEAPPDPVDGFWMSETTGKQLYLLQVANNLAAELTGILPWTITTYTPAQLLLLLNMHDYMYYSSAVSNPGYFFQYDSPSPASPGYTLSFFKSENLIGVNAADTIARLWKWERILTHYFVVDGDPTVDVEPYFWGPNTRPIPDSEIIEGTTYTGPIDFGFAHFTEGCDGTMQFMKSVLRSLNIPVERLWVVCGHAIPVFPTVGLAMTHGDDPYDGLGLISYFPGFSIPPASEYLITINQFNQLFPPGQNGDICDHTVGVQVANIAIKYGSDILMNLYCADLKSGADHASSQVYAEMKYFYPLQTLEYMGLWTTLDNKVNALNYCGF